MALGSVDLPLVVIVGPTASGKTSLAIELAREYGGEIIAADSRTVYKGMDIGSAKPDMNERRGVVHWGFDLALPSEGYSAAQFKRYAEAKIEEIKGRGKVPFLVGGTGLYVDAVLFDYHFGDKPDLDLRRGLEMLTVEELQECCRKLNIDLPQNLQNKRHLIRAIEQGGQNHKRNSSPRVDSVVVGIATDKEELRTKMLIRAEQFFEKGIVEEATLLGNNYGWSAEFMKGNIYKYMKDFIDGRLSRYEVCEQVAVSDMRLAKRQITWFKRNPYIKWLRIDDARDYLDQKLGAICDKIE